MKLVFSLIFVAAQLGVLSDSQSASGGPITDVEPSTVPSAGTCKRVVSIVDDVDNEFCMDLCGLMLTNGQDPFQEPEFTSQCMKADWHEEGATAVPDNDCFNTWFYGKESAPMKYVAIEILRDVDTPALCQSACQQNSDCVFWSWFSPLDASLPYTCWLKSRDMVKGALKQRFAPGESDPPEFDEQYCDSFVPSMCTWAPCLRCLDYNVCVYHLPPNINGFNKCGRTVDLCNPIA